MFERVVSAPVTVSGTPVLDGVVIGAGPVLSIVAATFRPDQLRLEVTGTSSLPEGMSVRLVDGDINPAGTVCVGTAIDTVLVIANVFDFDSGPDFPGGDPGQVCVDQLDVNDVALAASAVVVPR